MVNQTNNLEKWNIEKIKQGFDEFWKENGRLPTAPEIDKISYLPSSRQIQRKFGGLKQLRQQLGYEDVDFGIGKYRSEIAKKVGDRGKYAEANVEARLDHAFGEAFVHVQKKVTYEGNRVDIFVYTKGRNFAVDVFSCSTIQDLQKNLNIKVPKYSAMDLSVDLYFVFVDYHGKINDDQLVKGIANMSKLSTMPNLKVMSLMQFIKHVKNKYVPLVSPDDLVVLDIYT